ncbi:two-component system activity regulator YycH [Niallia sp. XMNu-256]|uniref:YycH family regulatory protein n=1 Tax=Niallia sp. XMNu-256 TaxID=3082444 RepID=UPI0030D38595
MKYEKAKSILLTILVVLGSILTWNLWTYQPNVEEYEKRSTVKEVLLSSPKDLKDIVKVDQILFTIGGIHYGTASGERIDAVMNKISSWHFHSFRNIPFHQVDPVSITKQHDSLQILYPSDLSSDLFSLIYKLNGDIPSFQFDQILIDFERSEGENGIVYFISQENELAYSSRVSLSSLTDFISTSFNGAKQLATFFPFTLESGRTIYLPEKRKELVYNQYLIKRNIDSDELKNALFSKPSLVQKYSITTGYEFTDGQNLMRENTDNHTITYIDPSDAGSRNSVSNNFDLIRKSIDFVNNHGGWTDPYRFVSFDEKRSTVHFRMYGPDGYPVFGDNQPISKLEVEWGTSEISRYNRNNFSLGHLANSQIKTLDSGHIALERIHSLNSFQPKLLQNVKIGYKMALNTQTRLVSLEPSWFYLYDGNWMPLNEIETGGNEIGLE